MRWASNEAPAHRVILASLLPVGLLDGLAVCIARHAQQVVVVALRPDHHHTSAAIGASRSAGLHAHWRSGAAAAWRYTSAVAASKVTVGLHAVLAALRCAVLQYQALLKLVWCLTGGAQPVSAGSSSVATGACAAMLRMSGGCVEGLPGIHTYPHLTSTTENGQFLVSASCCCSRHCMTQHTSIKVPWGKRQIYYEVLSVRPVGMGPKSWMISLWHDHTMRMASGVPMPAPLGSPAGPNQWFWGAPATRQQRAET